MRVDIHKLKFFAIGLLCVVVIGVMLVDLNRRHARIRTLTADVEAKEQQAAGTQDLSEEESRKAAEEERVLNGVLVGEESVPGVFDQITRAGSEHRVQLEIQSDEKPIPDSPADPLEANARALGITRYLVVTVKFRAEYSDAAMFLDSISRLPHALSMRSLELYRDPPSLSGTMRLHVYKRGAA